MATRRFVYLTYLDAIEQHFDLMRSCGEARYGVFDNTLIESALARPKHSASYEDADILRQAATLCYGLIKNHPWIGGNKRTASHLTEIFLGLNGYIVTADSSEIVELCLKIESNEWNVDETEIWLRNHTARKVG